MEYITMEFQDAVERKNYLKTKIMLKDSLLVDTSFKQFDTMIRYVESKGINIWSNSLDTYPLKDPDSWNKDLLNIELASLVTEFTREKVDYIKRMIQTLYPMTKQEYSRNESSDSFSRNSTMGYKTSETYNNTWSPDKISDLLSIIHKMERIAYQMESSDPLTCYSLGNQIESYSGLVVKLNREMQNGRGRNLWH